MDKRLFLLDAYALIYRSYYAFIKNPRINSKGENTSAIFGFVNTLEDLLRKEKPSHLAVAFDPAGKTFRHEAFEAYKAQREATPEDIRWSIPYIKQILEAYRIPILEINGFEADDVIGSMSKIAVNKGFDVYMMTPDKDYGQLVNEHCFIYKPRYGSSDFDILGPKEVCEKYSLKHPEQIIDYLALMGDASDNIPGCPGVGKVRAQQLLQDFDNVENLLEHTDKLKGSLKNNIENNKDKIVFSKFLATIKTDIDLPFDEDNFRIHTKDETKLMPVYERLEFRSWLRKFSNSETNNETVTVNPQQTISDTALLNPKNKSTKIELSNPSIIFKNDSQPQKEELQLDLFSAFDNEINADKCSENRQYENLSEVKFIVTDYQRLDNKAVIDDFLSKTFDRKKFAFSLNCDNSDAMNCQLSGVAISLSEKEHYFLPYPCPEDNFRQVAQIFEKEDIIKIGNQLKFSIIVLKRYGIRVKGNLFDNSVAHYLLQPEMNHQQEYLAEIYLHYHFSKNETSAAQTGSLFDFEVQDDEKSIENAIEKSAINTLLYPILQKNIGKEKLEYLCYQVEMPLIYVLTDMEYTGVSIDTQALKVFADELNAKLSELEKQIYSLADEVFNINSPKKVGEILFDKIGIEAKVKKTKTNKQYSTSEELLQSIKDKHPIVPLLLDYRGIKKLLSTYVESFPNLINKRTGKIHTSFNQTVTATGRLSSSNPNLQNIPVRDEMGKEMRRVFSVKEGYYFLSADYSQVELRIMAHLSKDENMIEAFHSGKDIHQATAARIFNLPLDEVTPDMRRKAKTANFGIIYGISSFGLAERMNVSRKEAKSIIDEYFVKYAAIKTFMDEAIEKARENQYVETLFHRKRYLPDIVSRNAVVRAYAERNAINAPIQGTAADIIKIAMVNIFKSLEQEQLQTKMIIQVHDELDFVVPSEELEKVKALVQREMENAMALSVPLKADIGYGNNWLEAH